MAAASAASYGVTIVLNRSLARAHLGAPTALGVRFSVAAAVLLGALAARGRAMRPDRGEWRNIFLLGFVGYMVESTLFFMGLERGTVGAVALLFYAYPAIVTLIELASGRIAAEARLFVALALSAVGSVVVVLSGSRLSITPAGAGFALGSALAFSCYLIASDRLVRTTDAQRTGAWVAAGAAVSFLLRGVVAGQLVSPRGHWPALIANGAATAAAFALMFGALRRLGPSRTSVVMTLEAFWAIVLAALFLGETLRPLQMAGGAAILTATVLIGLQKVAPAEV